MGSAVNALLDCSRSLDLIADELRAVATKLRAASDEGGASTEPSIDMLTVTEVAEALRLAASTVYRKVRSGAIPSVKIGGSRRVRRTDLAAYQGHALESEIEIRQPVTKWGRPMALPRRVAR